MRASEEAEGNKGRESAGAEISFDDGMLLELMGKNPDFLHFPAIYPTLIDDRLSSFLFATL